ncbi:MAG: hypothetical protein HOL85_17650 [Rhodospirillaceae bacterium]|jgi:hypothetical protein|nr:hypothetical protein [Rhodospirillaceae bacterium]MBT6135830.1 hypothetical protein [Rhodospirillaceae bacterium]
MADQNSEGSILPDHIAQAVGPERAMAASKAARIAIERLDRDNDWTQEAANVFQAATWKPKR